MAESSVVVEKSLRSVFVGNIPYEATEEKLRDIFGQAGPVASFKLMYDRESGKPKGYGFCEYKDQETALSAMRNLNGYEIGGRPLRVDNACTEKSRMEMQSLMMGNVAESPYGAEVEPDKAPEAISNAVASLPPEQMYELMRQMKLCVRNNSAEARTMLMNNPQLAYALLQAQVVMRIIDPKMAVQILHGSRDPVKPIFPKVGDIDEEEDNVVPKPAGPSVNGGPLIPQGPPPTNVPPPFANQNDRPPAGPRSGPPSGGSGAYGVQPPHPAPVPPPSMPAYPGGALQYLTEWPWSPIYSMDQIGGDHDLRQMGGAPRGGSQAPPFPPSNDQDMRMPPHHGHDNFNRPPPSHESNRYGRDFDQRDNRFRDGPGGPGRDRDSRESFGRDNRDQPRNNRDPRDSRGPDRDSDRDFRSKPPVDNSRDPRARNFPPNQDEDFRGMPSTNPAMPNAPAPNMNRPPPSSAGSGTNLPPGMDRQDQEKANLIMQVLQLSDEQIRMLPPEQQTSILQLKEQIQRSSH